jgi:hypothetical protein
MVHPVNAAETIYIRANGSIEGTTKISSANNITYTFTKSIPNRVSNHITLPNTYFDTRN